MALNLIKELSKQGHYRTKNKLFLINKVKNFDTEDIIKKNNILFKDPNTFLKLPKETEFDFIINKIPRGPQYDLDDKLIPYTMVGNEKYIKKKKILGLFNSKSFNRDKFKSKSKFSNVSRFNELKSGYNLITDKEIEEIFDNYKNKIKENKKKCKDLIDKNECSKVMKQFIDKNLNLQEKCLKKNEDNNIQFQNLKENINQKMRANINKKVIKNNNKSYHENNSSHKDIQLSVGELLMNSGEEYKLKNNNINFLSKNNSEFMLPEINQRWENSLRDSKNSIKLKTRMANFKLNNYFYWINISSVRNTENNTKNKKISSCSLYNDYSSSTNSIQNLFFPESKKSQISEDIIKNNFRKNFTSDLLEVKGKKLIDVEEKINKNLKGKKKILKYKNYKEEVKDMIIYSNYTYNNYHTSK